MSSDQIDQRLPTRENTFLSYCSVSPLFGPAYQRAAQCLEYQAQLGLAMFSKYAGDERIATRFHNNFAKLLKTTSENISMVTNTSEAVCMIANGYPFEPGDQVISYVHEYPANHYPWRLQERRGVELLLLSDVDAAQENRPYCRAIPDSFARAWSFEELERRITKRTKVIALSHVQFTSGFAADLDRLGKLCKAESIDLVIDAAQSLGCLPIYPEEMGIAAIASSGWKWLAGPIGTGAMYTSPSFREKIQITMTGADHMLQDTAYLDHSWRPYTTGKKFEYSTCPYSVLDALSCTVEQVFLAQPMEAVRDHNFKLQERALSKLDMAKYQPVVHVPASRSGILSLIPRIATAPEICGALAKQKIILTPRDGYIRFAPHVFTTEDEVDRAVEMLNALG